MISWIYAEVGVDRPTDNSSALTTLSDNYRLLAETHTNNATELTTLISNLEADNFGETFHAARVELLLQKDAEISAAAVATATSTAHSEAAALLAEGIAAMDAICLGAEQDYVTASQTLSNGPFVNRSLLMQAVLGNARLDLDYAGAALHSLIDSTYAAVETPDFVTTPGGSTADAQELAQQIRDAVMSGDEELVRDLLDVAATSGLLDDDETREEFIVTLGPEGLNGIWQLAADSESRGGESWSDDLTLLSNALAASVEDLHPDSRDYFTDNLGLEVLYSAMNLSPWPDDIAYDTAVRIIEGDPNRTLGPLPESIAGVALGEDGVQGLVAAGEWPLGSAADAGYSILADDPDLAYRYLIEDDLNGERLAQVVRSADAFHADDLIEAGLVDAVNHGRPSEPVADAFAELIQTGVTPTTDEVRASLVEVGGHFTDAIVDLSRDTSDEGALSGPLEGVTQAQLNDYYADLLTSDEARTEAGRQIAAYHELQLQRGIAEIQDQSTLSADHPIDSLEPEILAVAHLRDFYTESIEAGLPPQEDLTAALGLLDFGQSAALAVLPASPPLAIGSAGVSYLLSLIDDSYSPEQFDAESVLESSRAANYYTVEALADNYEYLYVAQEGHSGFPYDLSESDWETISNPEFHQLLNDGDDEAHATLAEILDRSGAFEEAVTALRRPFDYELN